MAQWQTRVQRQIDLDRCVGSHLLSFKHNVRDLEILNKKIRVLRAEILAVPNSPATPTLQIALSALSFQQMALLSQWKITEGTWLLPNACSLKFTSLGFRNLTPFPFVPEPPDLVGPRPLRWLGTHLSWAWWRRAENIETTASAFLRDSLSPHSLWITFGKVHGQIGSNFF